MCTVILLHRPGHAWPLLGANRDEMLARPWRAPAFHWPALPTVVAGQDALAGGTWLGMNGTGVVAAVLNRAGSLGPAANKASRGGLPLLALRHATAANAASDLAGLDSAAYRSFNLVIADSHTAWFLHGPGSGPVHAARLAPGVHMVSSAGPDDVTHARIARHLPAFAAAPAPVLPDWGTWPDLLADATGPWAATLNVPARDGFGTTSSALLGVSPGERVFMFAPGPPGSVPYRQVDLTGGFARSGPLL